MRVKQKTVTIAAITLGLCSFSSQASNGGDNRNWAPGYQSGNPYWQAPNWSNFSTPPPNRSAQPPAYNNNYRPQRPPAPAYRAPYAGNPPPAPANMNRPAQPATSSNVAPPPPTGPYRSATNTAPPPPTGSYRSAPNTAPPYGYNQGPSAFNTPGYNPYNDRRRNRSKFWGSSGPSTWMSPGKGNWERGWDDMINAPSRMGEMPGGWTAPEVTVPNPVDMGDQMQDNVEDLPDQMKNMDVGND